MEESNIPKRKLEPTYSTVTGMTGLPELVCGCQRIPGEQGEVGSRWTILKE